MKKLFFIFCLLLIEMTGYAQSYFSQDVQIYFFTNRYNNETDTSEVGWTKITDGTTGVPHYSAAVPIPINFQFNGVPVKFFKVSTTGILTFDTSVTGVPQQLPVSLPSNLIPNKSFCMLGLKAKGSNQKILMKVFGKAPQRQLWIKFLRFSKYDNITSDSMTSSLILEEGNNLMHVSFQYNLLAPSSAGWLTGIQTSSTDAVMLYNTSNFKPFSESLLGVSRDNVYFTFYRGKKRMYNDVGITSIGNYPAVVAGKPFKLEAWLQNEGFSNITNLNVSYSINGAAPVHESFGPPFFNIFASYGYVDNRGVDNFLLSNPITPPNTPGAMMKIKVWAWNPNGVLDSNNINDTITTYVMIANGTSTPKRRILYEQMTANWCHTCPDGSLTVEAIKKMFKDTVILASHHRGAGEGDAMYRPNNEYVNTYFHGIPSSRITRYKEVEHMGRVPFLHDSVKIRELAKNNYCPVKVKIISNSFDSVTRTASFEVEAEFTDYAKGEFRIGTMITEDEQRGVGSGWDQILINVTDPTHPYYGYPGVLEGYIHRNVVLDCPGGDFGLAGSIPDTLLSPGKKYRQKFTYTFPALNEKVTIPSTSKFNPTGTVIGRYNPSKTNIIAYVAMREPAFWQREVLNAESIKINTKITASILEKEIKTGIDVYPNPVSDVLHVKGLPTQGAHFTITDISGKVIAQGKLENDQINLSSLASSVYFLRIILDDSSVRFKIVKN